MMVAPSADSAQGWIATALGTTAAAGSEVVITDADGAEVAAYTTREGLRLRRLLVRRHHLRRDLHGHRRRHRDDRHRGRGARRRRPDGLGCHGPGGPMGGPPGGDLSGQLGGLQGGTAGGRRTSTATAGPTLTAGRRPHPPGLTPRDDRHLPLGGAARHVGRVSARPGSPSPSSTHRPPPSRRRPRGACSGPWRLGRAHLHHSVGRGLQRDRAHHLGARIDLHGPDGDATGGGDLDRDDSQLPAATFFGAVTRSATRPAASVRSASGSSTGVVGVGVGSSRSDSVRAAASRGRPAGDRPGRGLAGGPARRAWP